jgi:hypothetical protein
MAKIKRVKKVQSSRGVKLPRPASLRHSAFKYPMTKINRPKPAVEEG